MSREQEFALIFFHVALAAGRGEGERGGGWGGGGDRGGGKEPDLGEEGSFFHSFISHSLHGQHETAFALGERTQIKYRNPALVDLALLRMTSKI